MSTCTVPANQPIYQALIDKATFYSTYKSLKDANKYTTAANSIRATKVDIYSIVEYCNSIWNFEEDFEDEYEDGFPHIGSSIISFIFDYAKENPKPVHS
jgi:hypothetical protein